MTKVPLTPLALHVHMPNEQKLLKSIKKVINDRALSKSEMQSTTQKLAKYKNWNLENELLQ